MTTVSEMLNRFTRIDVINEIQQSLYDTREVYIRQQKDQMLHGQKNNTGLIGRYKSPAYTERKYALSSVAGYGNVDLKLKGNFYSGIFVEIRDDVLVIGSIDAKASALEAKYGNKIFGLNETYKVPFIDTNRSVFIKRIRAALHLQQVEVLV